MPPLPDPYPLDPLSAPFRISLTPPGSKSLTNRALLLGALAQGSSTLSHALDADDTRAMRSALHALDVPLHVESDTIHVTGGPGRLPGGGPVDVASSGTAARFLSAAALLAPEPVVIDGSEQMRRRPMGELIALLRALGARIEELRAPAHLPLRIHPLLTQQADTLDIGPTLSSQFISALLLVAPCLPRGLRLTNSSRQPLTSPSYVAMTLGLMHEFGAAIDAPTLDDIRISPAPYRACAYAVEPDASSASYFLAAAALIPGSVCTIEGLGKNSLQGDVACADALMQMGAGLTFGPDFISIIGHHDLHGIDIDLSGMPDVAMTLAVAALSARGQTVLRGLHTLRHKESDRLLALQRELTKFGAEVEIEDDAILSIDPPRSPLTGRIEVETYEDHRMAMAFAVAGLRAPGGVHILNPACVNKTYPAFWETLATLCASVVK